MQSNNLVYGKAFELQLNLVPGLKL